MHRWQEPLRVMNEPHSGQVGASTSFTKVDAREPLTAGAA